MKILTYPEREQLKTDGRKALEDTSRPLGERKTGLLNIIRAYYDRSREGWKGKGKYRHGTWKEFVQSWLFANGDRVIEQDVAAALRVDFPAPAKPRIQPGRSVWTV